MIYGIAALLVVSVVQTVVYYRLSVLSHQERDRLTRMAFADKERPAERIAALMPDRKPAPAKPASDADRPRKALGL